MTIQEKLHKLGISLPLIPTTMGAYVPVVSTGNLLFVSGQLPLRDGKISATGKVGSQLTLEQAQQAARLCIINALGAIQAQMGTLEQLTGIIRLEVFVNSAPGFTNQAQVANAASELLHEIFGTAGQHARLAVGVAELPLNSPVEIALIATL
jgi:enamine deaminase RidA (YjgF/YER057c/UK114 family)